MSSRFFRTALESGALIGAITGIFVMPFALSNELVKAEASSAKLDLASPATASGARLNATFSTSADRSVALFATGIILLPFAFSTIRTLRRPGFVSRSRV